jgi:hypothetical protein
MKGQQSELADAIHRLARAARHREGGGHPTPEQLAALRHGELSAEVADTVQDHLSVCRHCARLLLDLIEFEEPPEASDSTAADPAAQSAWLDLRNRMRTAPPLPTLGRSLPAPTPFRHFASSHPIALPAAACLAGFLLGLPLWYTTDRPRSKPKFVSLANQRGPQEPSPAAARPVRLDAAAVVLVIDIPAERPVPLFRVEIERSDHQVVPVSWTQIDSHTLLVVLTYHQLPKGVYHIIVLGRDQGGQPIALRDYPIRVLE